MGKSHSARRTVVVLFKPIAGRIRGVHTFPNGIFPNVNVIARLEYELAYYDSAVHRFNNYTTRKPPQLKVITAYTNRRRELLPIGYRSDEGLICLII